MQLQAHTLSCTHNLQQVKGRYQSSSKMRLAPAACAARAASAALLNIQNPIAMPLSA